MMRIAKSISTFSPLYRFCNNKNTAPETPSTPSQKKPTLIIRRQQKTAPSQASPTTKSYVMPQPRVLESAFMLPHPITFKNGRYLLYLNNQNLTTPFLLDLHYILPISYIAFLISTNPFYLTFPAALPLMFMAEAVYILRYVQHKAHHKRHIERIYLLETGTQIEIIYSNKIRRFMKNNPQSQIFDISSFQSKYDHQIQEGRVPRYRGVRFPANVNTPLQQAVKPTPLQYGWTIRDENFLNYIVPAKFEYADWQLLLNVLNGVPIDLPPYYITMQGEFMYGNFPKIQEQYKNIKDLGLGYNRSSKTQKKQEKTNNAELDKNKESIDKADKVGNETIKLQGDKK